jgi:sodium/hydrogen exchanger-like protein 6/7/sodium/hydrogen exchanger 8
MEVKQLPIGHETGVIIIICTIISIILVRVNETKNVGYLAWDNDLFFEFLLPLIIFTTGYNIRRKKFFENFANITKFGLMGTGLTFGFYFTFTMLLFDNVTMWKYDPKFNATATPD